MNFNIKEQDNHCHLIPIYFESIPKIINTILSLQTQTQLEYIVNLGLDYETNIQILNISNEYYQNTTNINDKFLRIGFGLHPETITRLGKSAYYEFQKISKLIIDNQNNIDYIGEIGLDFSYTSISYIKDLQIGIFEDICDLAIELKKPVSIHSRKSMTNIIQILANKKFNNKNFNGFLHCFTGNFEEGMQLISMGFKLGLNGIITYEYNKKLRKNILKIIQQFNFRNINEIIGLETDSPFLTPYPISKYTKNTPANIKIIKEYLDNLIKSCNLHSQ